MRHPLPRIIAGRGKETRLSPARLTQCRLKTYIKVVKRRDGRPSILAVILGTLGLWIAAPIGLFGLGMFAVGPFLSPKVEKVVIPPAAETDRPATPERADAWLEGIKLPEGMSGAPVRTERSTVRKGGKKTENPDEITIDDSPPVTDEPGGDQTTTPDTKKPPDGDKPKDVQPSDPIE